MALKLSVIGTGYLGATHAACMASLGFSVGDILKSITVVLECNAGIILFLQLQVNMNLQLLENSSINPLNAGWTESADI